MPSLATFLAVLSVLSLLSLTSAQSPLLFPAPSMPLAAVVSDVPPAGDAAWSDGGVTAPPTDDGIRKVGEDVWWLPGVVVSFLLGGLVMLGVGLWARRRRALKAEVLKAEAPAAGVAVDAEVV